MRDLILEKGLPANLDAERFTLAAMMTGDLDPGIAQGLLDASDFSIEKHRRIWSACMAVYTAGVSVDRVTVASWLSDRAQLESVDGLSYLCSLDEGMPNLLNIEGYIRLVKEKATLRRGVVLASSLLNRFLEARDEAGAVVADAERLIRDLAQDVPVTGGGLRNFTEIIAGFGGLNSYTQNHDPGIQTPWPRLNSIIGGFRAGQMIVIAGLTGSGKSALGLKIAEYAAANGFGTAVFSLEMSGQELFERLACGNAGIDSKKLERNRLSEVERYEFSQAASALSQLSLWVDDSTSCTLPAIHAALRRHMQQHPVRLLVLDYLQLVQSVGKENRTQQVSEISRGMKLIAREYKIPVIVLAQFNRAPAIEKREPQLHDLRESGSIEQDSDKVLFIHALEPKPGTPPDAPRETKLIVAKQRNGRHRRWVDLNFVERYCRFEEREG